MEKNIFIKPWFQNALSLFSILMSLIIVILQISNATLIEYIKNDLNRKNELTNLQITTDFISQNSADNESGITIRNIGSTNATNIKIFIKLASISPAWKDVIRNMNDVVVSIEPISVQPVKNVLSDNNDNLENSDDVMIIEIDMLPPDGYFEVNIQMHPQIETQNYVVKRDFQISTYNNESSDGLWDAFEIGKASLFSAARFEIGFNAENLEKSINNIIYFYLDTAGGAIGLHSENINDRVVYYFDAEYDVTLPLECAVFPEEYVLITGEYKNGQIFFQ